MSTGKKTLGRLKVPPARRNFDKLPLGSLSRPVEGTFYRLHSLNTATGTPWDPLHFSIRGTSRFAPTGGVRTLYLAEDLARAMMEVFDDHWGPVGSLGRSVTRQELKEWWVTLVNFPALEVFDATGSNLSKIGTDAQLLTAGYAKTRPRLCPRPPTITMRLPNIPPDQVSAGPLFDKLHAGIDQHLQGFETQKPVGTFNQQPIS